MITLKGDVNKDNDNHHDNNKSIAIRNRSRLVFFRSLTSSMFTTRIFQLIPIPRTR